MRGKSNAKLVPVAHLEELFANGAGFAGFAAGDIGQGPLSPDVEPVPIDGPNGEPSSKAEDFVDYYARLKRDEYHEVTDVVTQHELKRYLTFP